MTRPHSHVIQVAGYGVSFEALVQRFGARIDNGFSKPAEFSEPSKVILLPLGRSTLSSVSLNFV